MAQISLAAQQRDPSAHVNQLRQQGLVESTRGPGGGYTLARKADTITVADIVGAIEEGDEDHHAPQADSASSAQAMTQDLWEALHSTVRAYMQTITLQSLAAEQLAKGFQVQERKPVQKGVFQKPQPASVRPSVPNSVFALAQAWGGQSVKVSGA